MHVPHKYDCARPLNDARFPLRRILSSPAPSRPLAMARTAFLAGLAFALLAAVASAQSDEAGRSLLAVKKPTPKTVPINLKNVPKLKPKPTLAIRKKAVVKTFTGRACAKFGLHGIGCSLCTATTCATCGTTYMKSGIKCGEWPCCDFHLLLVPAAAALSVVCRRCR